MQPERDSLWQTVARSIHPSGVSSSSVHTATASTPATTREGQRVCGCQEASPGEGHFDNQPQTIESNSSALQYRPVGRVLKMIRKNLCTVIRGAQGCYVDSYYEIEKEQQKAPTYFSTQNLLTAPFLLSRIDFHNISDHGSSLQFTILDSKH